jgi:adenine-specific DNA-methyltransferase
MDQLRRLSQPFLNWSGKAERLSFEVPTLPLFVHERLSTQAIIETLKSHRKDATQVSMFDLFGDPQRPLADAITKAYEHQDKWVNRLILGDSLVVMNSLLEYERLGGQVQMIYIDPPYGVKFGSNFQPFVRKRDVSANDDADMTREPEMVKAYRDTWELGLHSYLAYLRDRIVVARELLHPTGSLFIQISEENLAPVADLCTSIFGTENLVSIITVKKSGGLGSSGLKRVTDFLIWCSRDVDRLKYRQLFQRKEAGKGETTGERYDHIELSDGARRSLTREERDNIWQVPTGARFYQLDNLTSGAFRENTTIIYEFEGKAYHPGENSCWKTTKEGLDKLGQIRPIEAAGNTLRYVRFIDDFPAYEINNVWDDVAGAADKLYVVQTSPSVIQRAMLMTTDPGDLVLDPTCGSGTTAYVAERWGRRWITLDTSRVPLALARQRLLTSTFDYFELKNDKAGPASGFVYRRRRNSRGDEIGGIIPHVTLGSLANNEPPKEEVLVDRPEVTSGVTRITGPFCFEATIPTPLDLDGDGEPDDGTDIDDRTFFVDRMLDTLRRAPILQLAQGRTVTLKNIRLPAKTIALSAEAMVDATADGQKAGLGDVIAVADETNRNALPFSQRPVAIVFGPENGAVSERFVYEAAQEAAAKKFTHLYVIGFSVQPNAENLIGQSDGIFDIPATWVPVTPDVVMGDLLKTTRASQIFSIAGRPEIDVVKVASEKAGDPQRWQVRLNGLDTFDPVTMAVDKLKGDDVPCWMLDADYNGRVFHASQAFFPRTKAWESLKAALKATHEASVWDHLAGSTSAPFEAGEQSTIAVKVIDDRGNELMVVKKLDEVR